MQTAEVAGAFSVSRSWVRRVKQRRREHGETAPRKMGGPGPVKIDRERLRELVAEQPDATHKELRSRLGVACSESAISTALKKMGLSYKKRRCTRASRTAPMSPSGVRTGVTARAGSTRRD